MTTCTVEKCSRNARARGLCGKHYQRWVKWGDSSYVSPYAREETVLDKFEALVVHTDTCWLWKGSHDIEGYPRMVFRGQNYKAHRWSYEHFNGSIPEGFVVDHMCHTKGCVNPEHLRAVTIRANTQNRSGAPADNKSAGRLGVSRSGPATWRATVRLDGKVRYLGTFDDIEVASWVAFRARQDAYDVPDTYDAGLGAGA